MDFVTQTTKNSIRFDGSIYLIAPNVLTSLICQSNLLCFTNKIPRLQKDWTDWRTSD